jgi:DNA-binding transcriptional ArsR family regulator
MKHILHPSLHDLRLPTVFYAVSDPVRLGVILKLADGCEKTCGDLECGTVGKSTMTHHFKVLREAGIVFTRVEGREYYTRLRREFLDEKFPGLLDEILRAAKQELQPVASA